MLITQIYNTTENAENFYGKQGNDILTGGKGSDYLLGEQGNDILVGGSGNDVLMGGEGYNLLTGGKEKDTFAIVRPPKSFSINRNNFCT